MTERPNDPYKTVNDDETDSGLSAAMSQTSLVDILIMSSSDNEKKTHASPSVASNSVGQNLLEFLRLGDLQRLTVTCKALQQLLGSYSDTARWLRDVEILLALRCPRRLRRKISSSLRKHPKEARLLFYHQGAGLDQVGSNLYNVYEEYFYSAILTLETPNDRFATMHPLTLEEFCGLEEGGDAFEEVKPPPSGESSNDHNDEDEDDGNLEPPLTKKPKPLECRSADQCKSHQQKTLITRWYFVHGDAYCGHCLDASTLLQVRFGAEHMQGHYEMDWIPQEVPYAGQAARGQKPRSGPSPEEWGLKDHQFWVRLFYTAPYNESELRFLGTGHRDC